MGISSGYNMAVSGLDGIAASKTGTLGVIAEVTGLYLTSFASSKYKKITYLLTLSAILLPQEALGRNLRVWLLFRANCESPSAAQRLLLAPRSADLNETSGGTRNQL
jgi:hypothetical protein